MSARVWRPWWPHEDDFLRLTYVDAGRDLRPVAEVLGRTRGACCARAAKLGLRRPSRPWSDTELRLLRMWWGTATPEELEQQLPGRTWQAIRQCARLIGLPGPPPSAANRHATAVLELNREMSDAEAGARLGLSRSAVYRLRRRLGVPACPVARASAARANGLRMAERHGPLSHRRLQLIRTAVAARGWPEETPMRGVLVVESQCDHGPATRAELAARLGMRPGSNFSCGGAGTERDVFARLRRLGLIHGLVLPPVRAERYFPTVRALEVREAFLRGQGGTNEAGETADGGAAAAGRGQPAGGGSGGQQRQCG